MTPDDEKWLPVVGYESAYEVSDRGRVRSLNRVMPHSRYPSHTQRLIGRVLRPGLSAGYPSVNLSVEARSYVSKVHLLMAESHLGPRPDGAVVCHADGDRTNNVLSNIRYGTVSENNYETVRHGHHWQAKKTHCKRGHEFTPENTIQRPRGHRRCLACTRARERRRWAKGIQNVTSDP